MKWRELILPKKEFRVMFIKMLTKLRKRMGEHNKEIEI